VATVTFLQLQTDSLLYCDQRPGGTTSHVNPTELKRLVNNSLREFYDLLVRLRGKEYYNASTTLAVVSGTATYNLPVTLYQLLSVTLEWNTRDHEVVRPVDGFPNRAAFVNGAIFQQWSPKAYALRGSQTGPLVLEFLPTPSTAVTARIQYVPTMTELVNDGDTFDVVNGWDKLVTLKTALEILSIKGSTKQRGLIETLYGEQLERIEALAGERDNSEPAQIRDVDPEGDQTFPHGWYTS
jgi:hypothetical protein